MKTYRFKSLLLAMMLSALSLNTMAYDFMVDGIAYNKNSDGKTVTVTYTEYNSSNNYSGLTTANIPATVTDSGITYSVTSIDNKAFYYCSGLTSVTIPNSVTSIGNDAFSYCSSLTKLTWNAVNCSSNGGMTTSNIETVTIGNQVQVLPAGFVSGSKITSVTIPNSVTFIGNYAFSGCSGLTSVTIGNSVTSIGIYAFQYCTGLTSLTIPNSVTSIGSDAFSYCSSLKRLNIPGSVSDIGARAFAGCTGLMSVRIANCANSTVVGVEAFYHCEGLTSVILPASLSSLGARAFEGCTGLTDVTCMRPRPVNIDSSVFKNVPVNGGCDLHVPEGSKPRYEAMAVWQDFLFIFEDAHDDEPTPTPTNGDVNGDGKVNVSDVTTLVNMILGVN